MKLLLLFFLGIIFSSCNNIPNKQNSYGKRENLFNENWQFTKDIACSDIVALSDKQNSPVNWEQVSLPHTANIEPLVIKGKQWQGTCWYRKFFTLSHTMEGKYIMLKFDGAMQVAEVYLNGQKLMTHQGGYLPFCADLGEHLKFGKENVVLIRLNNEDNPEVPPGKPVDELDFNIYSGIYRNVWLIVKNKLNISDPVEAGRVAGGGIFIRYPEVTDSLATLNVQVDVDNKYSREQETEVKLNISDKNGNTIAGTLSGQVIIAKKSNHCFNFSLQIKDPSRWSPDNPTLYSVKAIVLKDGTPVDSITEKTGMRTFNISPAGFEINGQALFLRGINRHQEYPYVGYAISDNANYRDAYKIKKAGFNIVRLSHYPQSPAFMDACDKLGLMVIDAIPGWQFFGDSVFRENALRDVREMLRRDRNHPSVVLWEASLNESDMSVSFMQKAHHAVHEEYPGKDVYSCGWKDTVYDVFIPARQHAKPPCYWNKYTSQKPIFIAEYGDWEYYAQNAGFNQKDYQNLSDEERNSRQTRENGQKRLARQALNFQEAHNSNMQGRAFGDANWLMFDYNRGYAPDIEASGIMDIFRLPKFAYYFYESQKDAVNPSHRESFSIPVIHIANFNNDPSFPEVKIYSNCDEVELLVNNHSLGKKFQDSNVNSTWLKHPPFSFYLNKFVPGKLVAKGYISGEEVISETRYTPGIASSLKVWIDESNRSLQKGKNDLVFLYAAVTDNKGTIVPDADNTVTFQVNGDTQLLGRNPIEAEAGIATVLLKAGNLGGHVLITAHSKGLTLGKTTIIIQ